MAHTPGPYQQKEDEVWAGDVHLADCDLYAYDDDYYDDHESLPGDAKDNARLFATVLDLLTACELALNYLEHQQFEGWDDTWYKEQLRDAIAKAKPV